MTEHAVVCLEALSRHGLGKSVSIGGALGLAYYLEFRETHDVDAWWIGDDSPPERQSVVRIIRDALAAFGGTRVREWGDVVSIDLMIDDKVIFGFQIARRDVALEQPREAPWPEGLSIDGLPDLVASKMVALVERGAPRDFRDIHAVCENDLSNATLAWDLWRRRETLAGRDADPARARAAVLLHLSRIETHRPLDGIADTDDRDRAAKVRAWFKGEFIHALVD